MAEPLVVLDKARVTVDPGGQARVVVSVTNPGTRVEGYDLVVLGADPIPWAQVEPNELSVYPQQTESATVIFRPPVGPQTRGGEIVFGVRARSHLDEADSAVVEGLLTVTTVHQLQGQLRPVTSTGRWRGRHTITVINDGNTDAVVHLVPSDPNEALGYLVRPPGLSVPIGESASAALKVRTRKPVLRGEKTRLPFQVACEPDVPEGQRGPVSAVSTPQRPVLDGALEQKPILTRAVVAVGAAAAVVLAGGVAYALTRPLPEEPLPAGVAPEAPADLAVGSVSDTSLTLTWTRPQGTDRYSLRTVDPTSDRFTGSQELPGEQEQQVVEDLAPDTEYCFKLVAVRDGENELTSPPSQRACGTTTSAAATAEPTTSPAPTAQPGAGGSPGPTGEPDATESPSTTASPEATGDPEADALEGKWISAVQRFPKETGRADEAAQLLQQRLAEAGIESTIIDSDDYPDISPPLAKRSLIVIVGAAETREEAAELCKPAQALNPLYCSIPQRLGPPPV